MDLQRVTSAIFAMQTLNQSTAHAVRTISNSGPVALYRAEKSQDKPLVALRRMIWLYFWLLIFEGALRKWVVPSLSTPLLVIRDPLVLLIYFQAIRCRRFPLNAPMVGLFLLLSGFILLSVIQIISGIGGGPLVTAYGLRTNFLHLPLIFVLSQVFGYQDVLKLGKWVLVLSIPMAVLMVIQFLSSPTSWINAATIAGGQQIQSAMGKIRPAGTFSFATGVSHFYVLATTFVVFALANGREVYPRWLVWAALASVAAVQPVSGSRVLVLGCALVLVAAIAFAVLNPHRSGKILAIALPVGVAVVVLSMATFFQEGVTVFMQRWNDASAASGGVESGVVWRFFGGFLEPFLQLSQAGLMGQGIGMGTNAGSALMTGAPQFLLAEGEWARVVLEAGPLLGFSFLGYRVAVAGLIASRGTWAALRQQILPWLLAWSACRSIVIEQISQPTNLGFMVLLGGLCLASIAHDHYRRRFAWKPTAASATCNEHSFVQRS
jgi:hypothetical protein